jgi:hypothetical protein
MATGRTIRRHHYRRRPSSTLRLITIITAKVLQLTIMSTTMMNSSRLTYSCCHAFVARLTVHAASSTSGRGQQHQHHDSRRLKTFARGAAVGWGGDSSTILTCSSHNKVAAETKRCSVIMSRRTTSSSTTSLLSTAIDVEKEAAVKSKFISGSKTVVKDFGGITYRETSQCGGTGSEEEIFRVVFILGGPGPSNHSLVAILFGLYSSAFHIQLCLKLICDRIVCLDFVSAYVRFHYFSNLPSPT